MARDTQSSAGRAKIASKYFSSAKKAENAKHKKQDKDKRSDKTSFQNVQKAAKKTERDAAAEKAQKSYDDYTERMKYEEKAKEDPENSYAAHKAKDLYNQAKDKKALGQENSLNASRAAKEESDKQNAEDALSDFVFKDYLTDLMNSDNKVAQKYRDKHGIDTFDFYDDYADLVTKGGKNIWSQIYTSDPTAQAAYIDTYGDLVDLDGDGQISNGEAAKFWQYNEDNNDDLELGNIATSESAQRVYGGVGGSGANNDIADALIQGFATQGLVDEFTKLYNETGSDVSVGTILDSMDLPASSEGQSRFTDLAATIAQGYGKGDDAYDSALQSFNNYMKLENILGAAVDDGYNGQAIVDMGNDPYQYVTDLFNNIAGGSSGVAVGADGDKGYDQAASAGKTPTNPANIDTGGAAYQIDYSSRDDGYDNPYESLDNAVKYFDTGTKQAYNNEVTEQGQDVKDALDQLLNDGTVSPSLVTYLVNNMGVAGDDGKTQTLKDMGAHVYSQSGDFANRGPLTGNELEYLMSK